MNTQNVNVKTATKESSERWVKTSSLRTDGGRFRKRNLKYVKALVAVVAL